MIHLRAISLKREPPLPDGFPFNVPVIQSLSTLRFERDVTFFVGDNGSGKSTVLEAIAVAATLPTIGSANVADDPTLADVRRLSDRLKWEWTKRVRAGFFMRSEDFFGFTKRINQEMSNLKRDLEADDGHTGQSAFARPTGEDATCAGGACLA